MGKKEKKVKEKIKNTEQKEKQSKVNSNKKKKLLVIISVIALVAIISITIFLILRNDDEYKLIDVEPTISTLEDGTYYIFGSPNNQSFEVEVKEDFTYKVVDEDSNEVKVTTTKKDNKVVINAPEELYEDGKTYTLTITNGTFVEEDLKEATTVSFSIVRKSKQTSELNENVKAVSSKNNKVSETDDKITLTSKEEYKTGDIILVDDKKAYKIESKEDDTYKLTTPKLTEVFDEIDYYGSVYLNLSDFEESKEIEEYLIAYAEENLIDKLIPNAYAAPKISVNSEWSKKRDALVATIHIETDPGDKVFKKSFLKHHKFSFDYEVELKTILDYDIDDDYVDVNLTLQITNTPSFKLETQSETLDKIKDGLKAYTAGENALALLKSDYESVKKDTKNLKQTVGTVEIPMPPELWFISSEIDFGLIMDFDVKANMEAKLTNTNKVTIGINSENGIYGKTKNTNKINANAFGNASMRLGSQMDLEVSLLGIVEVSGGVKGGIYGKATLDMKSEITEDKQSASILATTKAGLFSTIVVKAKVIKEKYESTIFDKELELYSYELPIQASSEKTETVVKQEDTTQKTETNNNSNSNSNNNNSNNNTTTPPPSEKKYYTVTLYYFADCCEESIYRICNTVKTYKVEAGTALKNTEVDYDPIGMGEIMYYHNYLNRAKKYNETRSAYESCYSTCKNNLGEGENAWSKCYEPCLEQYNADEYYGIVNDYNINNPINSDISIVVQTGCGAA